MTTYFTSDWHLSHKNIIKYCNRPFKSIKEMNNTIIKRYNKTVNENDEVWFLGDLSLQGVNVLSWYMSIFGNLRGTKHLVLGNHDRLKPNQYLDVGFSSVHTSYKLVVEDLELYLVHDPASIQIPNSLSVCGHIHTHWKRARYKKLNTVFCNVGVEKWNYYPVSLDEVLKVLKGR